MVVISKVNILKDADDWWIDSGATRHVCNENSFFNTYEPVDDGTILYMGNSSTATIKGKGIVDLEFTSGKIVSLTNVCHVPEVRKNLVSGSLLNKHGFKLVFKSDKFILSKGGILVGKGYLYQGMFKLNINNINNSIYMLDSFYLWHARLGHVNTRKMNDMVKLDLIPKYDNNIGDRCKICMHTKITRMAFPKVERTTFLLQLVHSDVCDMHSSHTMLSNSGLTTGYWGEALLVECYILNRIPIKKNNITPYELWKNKKPNLSYFRTWGCRAIIRLPDPKRKKLGEKGIECILLGYALHSKAYRFLVIKPNSSIGVNKIIESRDAVFYENRFTTIPRLESNQEKEFILLPSYKTSEPPSESIEPIRSKRARIAKSFGPNFVVYLVEGTRNSLNR